MTETYASEDHLPDPGRAPGTGQPIACFTTGTRIMVPGGDCPVERLEPGMTVETLDHGPQRLVWVGRRGVSGKGPLVPVVFEPGAIGNDRRLRLSAQHRLLLECPRAKEIYGRAQVLVPAISFVGLPGITLEPADDITYFHLLFDRHELISAEGVVCESLLLRNVARTDAARKRDATARENVAILPGVLAKQLPFGTKAARWILYPWQGAELLGTLLPDRPWDQVV